MVSSSLLQVVNSLFQTCLNNVETSSANTRYFNTRYFSIFSGLFGYIVHRNAVTSTEIPYAFSF